MKICKKCYIEMSSQAFDNDKSRPDGKYPYCRDCRRQYSHEKYGRSGIKQRSLILRNCSECAKAFLPRRQQVDDNKTGDFFCCNDHRFIFLQKKRSAKHYSGYRRYIIERDFNVCVLCQKKENLHVHHIITRGAGGKNDYKNLITLCMHCHLTKAHGVEGTHYREIFMNYTKAFVVPEDWQIIMERSNENTDKIRKTHAMQRKRWREKINGSEMHKEQLRKEKDRSKQRKIEYKEKFGLSYGQITYRAMKIARKDGVSISDARQIVIEQQKS